MNVYISVKAKSVLNLNWQVQRAQHILHFGLEHLGPLLAPGDAQLIGEKHHLVESDGNTKCPFSVTPERSSPTAGYD